MQVDDLEVYVNDDDSFSRAGIGKPKGYIGPLLCKFADKTEILFDFDKVDECNEQVEYSVRHDGTHLFILQCFEHCIAKMVMADPSASYIVGKITRTEEFDMDGTKFAPKEKPWCRERTTYRIEYKKEKPCK